MDNIAAYILAGGKSSRMGNDKGLKILNHKPMIQYSIDVLKTCFSEIKIISNNNDYSTLGLEIREDIIKGKGPLAGIFTALKDTQAVSVFIMSCDLPFITEKAIRTLINSYKYQNIMVASYNHRIQPLCGFYSKELLSKIKNNLDNNQLKMVDFLIENEAYTIEIEEDIFRNINTPGQFKEASKLLRK